MKNIAKIGIGMMLAFMLMCVVLPMNVAAKSGTKAIPAGGVGRENLGYLTIGDKVTYSWACTDSTDDMEFQIEDSYGNGYEYSRPSAGGSGVFVVPDDGNYELVWKCNNDMWDGDMQWSYTIDKNTASTSESSGSPGFELFGVALAIGLCIAIIGWRRKR